MIRGKGTPGLALPSVLGYLADAAEALRFLHTQDPPVIHDEVKPANLILARGRRIKLVDFGLSSTVGGERSRDGTAGFMAPDLCEGEPPSRASDVCSLAGSLQSPYSLPPRDGDTPALQHSNSHRLSHWVDR